LRAVRKRSKLDPLAGIELRKAVGMVLATALGCEIGLVFLHQGFWLVTPIWPPVGVALAAFLWIGNRALPWLVLGHCWILVRLDPTILWALWFIPLLYPLEGWLAARLSLQSNDVFKGRNDSLLHMLCKRFLCPAFAVLPCMAVMAALLYLAKYSGGTVPALDHTHATLPGLWATLSLSHLLGLITVGPLLSHLLRGEAGMITNLKDYGHPIGPVLALAAMVLLVLGFSGQLNPVLSPQAVVMLPVPLFFLAAIWLNGPQTLVLSTACCLTSLYLAGLGHGPYGQAAGLTYEHIELGLYNLMLVFGMQTLSTASSNHHRQIRHRNLVMEAAGMLPWRWTRSGGLVWEDGSIAAQDRHGKIPRLPSEACLLPKTAFDEMPDRWNQRINGAIDGAGLWDVVGRVLLRDTDGNPGEVIGLVKDASADERARQAMLALQHQRALMHGLQARLNPHFLFNSLNLIHALVHTEKDKAARAVLNLAKLLRMTLESSEQATIPLAAEIESIRALMEIAVMRFEERLTHQIEVPETLRAIQVPAMLLFNLAENAITHGIANIEQGGHVRLDAKMKNDHLSVRIRNSGTLDPGHKRGVGLSDALQRLELIYRGRAALDLRQSEPGIVTCTLNLPLET